MYHVHENSKFRELPLKALLVHLSAASPLTEIEERPIRICGLLCLKRSHARHRVSPDIEPRHTQIHFTNGGRNYWNTISFPGFTAYLKLDGQSLYFSRRKDFAIKFLSAGCRQRPFGPQIGCQTDNIGAEDSTEISKNSFPALPDIAFCLQLALRIN